MKLFYGWRMVGAGAMIQFLHAGLLMQAFGAYVAVLSEERGWSKTALSGGAALQSLEGAVLGPALGWAMDRFGARSMVQAGILIFGAGFLVLSQVDTLMGFYGAVLLLALGTSLSGYFPLTVTLVHWFRKRRARALSTMGLGLALGGVVVPAVAWTMQAYGWRTTAFASGVLSIVVGWPLARVLRRHPSDMGETEDGIPPQPAVPGASAADLPERHFTAREALRTPAFWLLALGHGFALLVVTAVNVHAISHMKEGLGYTLGQASFVITLMTVAQVGGVLLGAAVGDRWDKAHIAAGCMLAHAVGLLMLTFAVHPAMLGAFAILHGMAWGLRGPLMQALRADYFGLQAIGMIMGLSAFIISVGQVAGPMVAGAFADATGSYRWGFTALALVAGSGSLLFMLAKKPK
ncbi:MFS transporter [Caenimonas sedimenti]|uniref:MFS transporter n=1 Tax=Caenimonas sedimenti TaxID=2596921 RepID=A0A562ZL27_9BURK|nr:MFS transporter [Caenimonas sedimenti]TWO69035.1 MFS transporter [Caenimonas sedimenti]